MNRAALYLRVSTDEQTTANQLPELEALAARRGLTITATYSENESAAKRRPEFDRMLADAERGRFDCLLIWSLDRLGRSMVGNLDSVRRLDRAGVALVSAREPWLDTTGPTRDLLLAIFSWVAEQERRRLVERTRAGLARARKEGVRLGRPRVSTWKTEQAVGHVYSGASVREAARRAGIGEGTLRRALAKKAEALTLAVTPSDGA